MIELSLKWICVRNLLLESWIQGENNHKSTADNCSQEEMTAQIASGDSLVKHGQWNLWKKQANHKPSFKAAFFLSAWTNRWALHHSPSRHEDWLCEQSTRLHGSEKDSRSKGCLLRKAGLFPTTPQEDRKYSLRCKTQAESESMTQGNTWLVWVSSDSLSRKKSGDSVGHISNP